MMTCNDCGRDIRYCDRYGCREVNGVAWECRGITDAKAAFDKHASELDATQNREGEHG